MIEKPSVAENQTSSSEYHYESQKIEEFEKSSAPSYRSENLNQEEENHIQEGTHRGLDARHIQMISLGGAIGYDTQINSHLIFLLIRINNLLVPVFSLTLVVISPRYTFFFFI